MAYSLYILILFDVLASVHCFTLHVLNFGSWNEERRYCFNEFTSTFSIRLRAKAICQEDFRFMYSFLNTFLFVIMFSSSDLRKEPDETQTSSTGQLALWLYRQLIPGQEDKSLNPLHGHKRWKTPGVRSSAVATQTWSGHAWHVAYSVWLRNSRNLVQIHT